MLSRKEKSRSRIVIQPRYRREKMFFCAVILLFLPCRFHLLHSLLMGRSHTMRQPRSAATAHYVLHCAVRFPQAAGENTSSRIQPYSIDSGQTWCIHPHRPYNMPPAVRRICFLLCFCEKFLACLQDKTYIIDVGPGIPSPILAVVPGAGVFFFIVIPFCVPRPSYAILTVWLKWLDGSCFEYILNQFLFQANRP